jgi:hypothetical protein
MKIKRYELEITIDFVHGWKSTIDEVYVPDVDLFINKECCFIGGGENKVRMEKAAGTVEEEIPDNLALLVVRLANALKDQKSVVDDIRTALFKDKS